MLNRLALIEVDGKRYMDTKTAAGLWGITQRRVARSCRDGRVPGAFKDTSRTWCIPVNAESPLTDAQIRGILDITLQLRNTREHTIDYSTLDIPIERLQPLYHRLALMAFIRPIEGIPPERLPYDVVLTKKGFDLVYSANSASHASLSEYVLSWSELVRNIMGIGMIVAGGTW